MVMDGAVMAEKMAVFLAMASMGKSLGKSWKISTFQGGNSLTGASAEDVFFHFLSDVAASTASTAW
jgi:hypothetical protein